MCLIKRIEIGKIAKAHGLGGEIKLLAYTDQPQEFCNYRSFYIDDKNYRVTSLRYCTSWFLCRLEGIDTLEQVQKIAGKPVFINRAEISEPLIINDILGMDVYYRGAPLGRFSGFFDTGASKVFEINYQGKECLVLYNERYFKLIDQTRGVVELENIEELQ
ncbi:MAG: 16S rRNA processing protein RimM [Spirochaetes bacterium GWF1_41_5]|nr:MAG: 16S rRNA processing protein RimM [Spirochaetes bacterium GWF1_41_5]